MEAGRAVFRATAARAAAALLVAHPLLSGCGGDDGGGPRGRFSISGQGLNAAADSAIRRAGVGSAEAARLHVSPADTGG